VLLPDKPGSLVNVASVIAKEQGNIIRLEHNQFVSINRNTAVELVITMEAFGHDHKEKIVKALQKAGFNPEIVMSKKTYNI
jgi:threonine dehydratase